MDRDRDDVRAHEASEEPQGEQKESSPWHSALLRIGRCAGTVDRLGDALNVSAGTVLRYHLNLRESRLRDRLVIDLMSLDEGGRLRPKVLEDGDPRGLEEEDAGIVGLLFGAHGEDRARGHHAPDAGLSRCAVRPSLYPVLLPQLARSGRLFADLALAGTSPTGPLRFAGSRPFEVRLLVRSISSSSHPKYRMSGVLVRDRVRLELESSKLLLSDGLALVGDEVVLLKTDDSLDWAIRLRRHGAVEFPSSAKDGFLLELARMPDLPELDLPPELHWSQVRVEPQPKVVFSLEDPLDEDDSEPKAATSISPYVRAHIVFSYGGIDLPVNAREAGVVDERGRRLFRRDLTRERGHLERLRPLDLKVESGASGTVRLPRRNLADLVKALIAAGWSVEADGAIVRTGGVLRAKVKSGIDWFDLDAVVAYTPSVAQPSSEGEKPTVKLPELLRAASAGRPLVRLADGSRGIVPDWAKRYASLARVGQALGGKLRFLPSQAGVIDVLLAGQEPAEVDIKFERLRRQLASAPSPDAVREPEGFAGRLRDYQRAGVAWMQFLEAHGYGGCLADDMGLGKTVQVLSVLQARHPPHQRSGAPSLVVVPKSLIHNWVAEAEKFTQLRVLDFTGSQRTSFEGRFEDYDLVVTTYGTLRREILKFTEMRFASLVLDEAQAIKNPRSQAAKACRLVQADHRLAISGTPIENGLEELWSLFEFLNPGMLGSLGAFASCGREQDEAWLEGLARALKPFMLRRTKDQVLQELPGKTVQLWEVPLSDEEQGRYDELRAYYRRALQGVLDNEQNLSQARIHVLEALLRLRQAACHAGLLDPARLDEGSAKIDALFDKLAQIVPRGHKALVFSQFTTLLDIVRRRLDREGIAYAYLDGATPDRKKTVTEFTDNPNCAVFLISLKAGGCGLNLTESDYVFILDPWWNPAIEAQAIDRAHRMGQKNKVFAYKLIAKDTVEEKIVHLQGEKRRLADAIVTADTGPLDRLDAEDLAQLLGREETPVSLQPPPPGEVSEMLG